jgi:hypothetical protein
VGTLNPPRYAAAGLSFNAPLVGAADLDFGISVGCPVLSFPLQPHRLETEANKKNDTVAYRAALGSSRLVPPYAVAAPVA